jgi:hypothetical protein
LNMSVQIKKQRSKRRNKPKGDSVAQYTSDAWSLAKRTAVGLNEIRKLINIEVKYIPLYTSINTGSTTTITPLSSIAQGLTSQTRVGDSIRIQEIDAKFILYANSASSGSVIRVTLIRDLEGQGNYPTAALVYEDTSAGPNILVSPLKFNESNRFSVLEDFYLTVCNGTFSEQHVFREVRNGHIKYLAATATESAMGNGQVYSLVTGSDNTNKASLSMYSRILYTDD